MMPNFELVQVGRAESFKAWEHGYPSHTVCCHFHSEFELHYVVETTGRYFVGDFIGNFEAGNLVLTGPNLPHNWISNAASGAENPRRDRVLQFSERFLHAATQVLRELSTFSSILELSRRGALFTPETGARVGPLLGELILAKGVRRIELFMAIVGTLISADGTSPLISLEYVPDPSGIMSTGLSEALTYINRNLNKPLSATDLAAISGCSSGTFSRRFRRHTGMTVVQYVSRLRINLATQFLTSNTGMSIADISGESGFISVSSFTDQFVRQKGMLPLRFRSLMAESAGEKLVV